MLFIRQNATHKVVVGPAVAVGDGFTPVTTLNLATADEAEAILHDNGTVVDVAAYTFGAIATADGYYHLTLQAAISGTVGHLTIVVNDDSLILPLRADFTIVEEAVYDAFYAASAVGVPSIPADWITATGIAADAITAAKIADDAISAEHLNTGALTADAFAADALVAATFATDSIAADALAADAVAEIADAVWDEARADHVSAGSFGQSNQIIRNGTAQAGGSATITLDAGASSIDSFYNNCTVFIVSGTGVAQSRRIAGYNGTTKVANVANVWQTNPNSSSVFVILPRAELAASITSANISSIADAVWDEAGADHVAADSMGAQLETKVDAIAVDAARLTAARAAVLTDLINGGRLDLLIDAIKGVTDNLSAAAETMVTGAAAAGTLSMTQMTTDLTEATNDHYNGRVIIWTSGQLQNQATDVTDYDGATKMLTYTAVTEPPADGDTFVIV